MCMVFEMMGQNLLSLIKYFKYGGIPLDAVKVIARQVCEGLDYAHRSCHLIHTDLKPENILICLPVREQMRLRELAHKAHSMIHQAESGNGKIDNLAEIHKAVRALVVPRSVSSPPLYLYLVFEFLRSVATSFGNHTITKSK